jgi:hypothetical protein
VSPVQSAPAQEEEVRSSRCSRATLKLNWAQAIAKTRANKLAISLVTSECRPGSSGRSCPVLFRVLRTRRCCVMRWSKPAQLNVDAVPNY